MTVVRCPDCGAEGPVFAGIFCHGSLSDPEHPVGVRMVAVEGKPGVPT